ncbi:myb-like DNA binding domain-containing protein [Fusarium phyllophilum]|uniref:Myb-like DNA binding domain-containing protein n=1 Tax=Fusarium phyllophilum TaxID=47803 RepID=A0A8H5JVV6_9HYPO|nr:myb-like DNA binding domain-containing protein [Fusarium phyllophilum]
MSDVTLNEDPCSKDKRSKAEKEYKKEIARIFAKYNKDFRDTGDEISMETGEIVVDNGHLRGMSDKMPDKDVWVLSGDTGDWGLGSTDWTENTPSPQSEAEPANDDSQDEERPEDNVEACANSMKSPEACDGSKPDDRVRIRKGINTRKSRLSNEVAWLGKKPQGGFLQLHKPSKKA